MTIKNQFLKLGHFALRSVNQLRHHWLGNGPFKVQYPGLNNIARNKGATVQHITTGILLIYVKTDVHKAEINADKLTDVNKAEINANKLFTSVLRRVNF
jgi:hypothetical protein